MRRLFLARRRAEIRRVPFYGRSLPLDPWTPPPLCSASPPRLPPPRQRSWFAPAGTPRSRRGAATRPPPRPCCGFARAEPPGAAGSLFRSLPLALCRRAPGELLLVGAAGPLPARRRGRAGGAGARDRRGLRRGERRGAGRSARSGRAADRERRPARRGGRGPADAAAARRLFVHVNGPFARLFGFAAGELVGQPRTRVWGPLTDRRPHGLGPLAHGAPQGRCARSWCSTPARATPLWTELGSSPVAHEHGDARLPRRHLPRRDRAQAVRGRALGSEKRKLQTTLASIADAVVTVLGDGRVEFVNAAAQRLLGIALIDAYGARVSEVIRLVDDDGAPLDVVGRRGQRRGRAARRGPAAHRRPAWSTWPTSPRGSTTRTRARSIVLRDVTAENRLSLRLSFEANHDPLTGLPNRRALLERLARRRAQRARAGRATTPWPSSTSTASRW